MNKMKVEIKSVYENISAREHKKIITALNKMGAVGLTKFTVIDELMTRNPTWFADDLFNAVSDYFYPRELINGVSVLIKNKD